MEPSTTELWVERVAAWRSSGERAEEFSRRDGYAASTLRWWASKLKREMIATARSTASIPIARVVRTSPTTTGESATADHGRVVLEMLDAGVRIAVERGADASTLAMVLEAVRAEGRR